MKHGNNLDFSSGSVVKNLPASAGAAGDAGDVVRSLGQKESLELEMATPSSILWDVCPKGGTADIKKDIRDFPDDTEDENPPAMQGTRV